MRKHLPLYLDGLGGNGKWIIKIEFLQYIYIELLLYINLNLNIEWTGKLLSVIFGLEHTIIVKQPR